MDVLHFSVFETKAHKCLLNDIPRNREHSQHFPKQKLTSRELDSERDLCFTLSMQETPIILTDVCSSA